MAVYHTGPPGQLQKEGLTGPQTRSGELQMGRRARPVKVWCPCSVLLKVAANQQQLSPAEDKKKSLQRLPKKGLYMGALKTIACRRGQGGGLCICPCPCLASSYWNCGVSLIYDIQRSTLTDRQKHTHWIFIHGIYKSLSLMW